MRLARLLSWTLGLTVAAMCVTVSAHERKEVAGLEVVFGAEGPFTGRMGAREPGVVATQHILTAAGEYEATLTFKKKGDATVHSVTFPFKIRDRKELEIP